MLAISVLGISAASGLQMGKKKSQDHSCVTNLLSILPKSDVLIILVIVTLKMSWIQEL